MAVRLGNRVAGLGGASLIVPLYVVELGGGPVTLGVLAGVTFGYAAGTDRFAETPG